MSTRRILAMLASAALVAAACGCSPAEEPAPAPQPEPIAEPTSTTEPTATGQPLPLERISLGLTPLARGLDQPLFVTHAGDGSGRLFVVEQTGRIRVLRGGSLQPGAFLDVSQRITTGGERGLLGLAFSPKYAENGRFYVNYTDGNGDTVVARFTAEDPGADLPVLDGPEMVLRVKQPYANHNGGCIVFGPDGYLYVGMGDGGSGGDPKGNGQNKRVLLGKMLRIDVESPVSGTRYRIPAGNPSEKDSALADEIWMTGLRNPWRFSFDRETGAMWIGDVGQGDVEEIDVAGPGESGQNWGWNVWEGSEAFRGGSPSKSGYDFPIAEYTHRQGGSVTGGYVYRGSRYPALVGTYLYGDFVSGWVGGLQWDDPAADVPTNARTRVLIKEAGSPSSFGEDENGELYLCDWGGTVYRITAKER